MSDPARRPPPRRPIARRALVALACAAALLGPARPAGTAPENDEAQALLARARAAAADDPRTALRLYVETIRAADEYATKYAAREEALKLPPVPARPLSPAEEATVVRRIAEERQRDVEGKAGGLEGRGKLHGSRLLHARLREMRGLTGDEESAHAKAIERIERRLCDEATEEERAEASAAAGTMADPPAVFRAAERLAADGKGRTALRVFRAISFSSVPDQPMRDRARAAAEALRAKMIDAIPEAEQREADAIWEDPHWKGLATSLSHEFVFIGAKAFVETIAPADRVKMDLACALVGDLVGRDLTGDGERLTIYYKERFDFPGGVAGGKRIDIGDKAIGKPIAGALHYHELSHCSFDVGIAYPGFTEGIANFGAVFLLDALGAPAEADAQIRSNRAQYQDDYLGRRLAYFRIQPYGPSCGFLLSPITLGDPEARKGQWATYRRFFRRVRTLGIGDPRDAERMRYFAWIWGEHFGWSMLDVAAAGRFPVVPEDRERVAAEYADGLRSLGFAEREAEEGFASASETLERLIVAHPASELCDRARFALARCREVLGDVPGRDALHATLGVIRAWKLCGPFYTRHASPLFAVHEPERAVDLAAEYGNPVETARWKDAKPDPDGRVDLLAHGYAYPDNAACYALAEVTVPKDVPDARLYLGFDDTAALWVNGLLVEKWDVPHGWVRDHHVGAFPLKAGRNRVLLKVVNRAGAWGFSARLVRADRTPIEGLAFVDPAAKDPPPEGAAEGKGHPVFSEDFEKSKSLSKSRYRPTVGGFAVEQKALRRTVPGNVAWRKFQIQPFGSKDPPSGLLWLVDKDLSGLADFAVEVGVRLSGAGLPKFAVTLHGEGKDDGLSGHTFVVRPGGEGLEVRLEEYDRLVYFATADLPRATDHVLRFVRRGRTLSCTVDGKPFLENVDLPSLSPPGIGLMTWDERTGVTRIRVERLK